MEHPKHNVVLPMYMPTIDGIRDEVLNEAQTHVFSLHPGATKLFRELKSMYWLPGTKRSIVEYIGKCLICQ